MKIVAISDTHGKHWDVKIPDGDWLIHCGDFSSNGRLSDTMDFLKWFNAHPHCRKIFIAGNHDWLLEKDPYFSRIIQMEFPALTYLQDQSCELDGLKVHGSPISPRFFNWAFNRSRGEEIRRHWDLIPEGTDVLITHGPPFQILDRAPRSFNPLEQPPRLSFEHVGCRDLLNRVVELDPKLHLFGHIHYDGGKSFAGKLTTFCNAAVVDENYNVANKPQVFII